MEDKDKLQGMGITMHGVTVNGPMFDIHDNGTVNYYMNMVEAPAKKSSAAPRMKDVLLALLEATDEQGDRLFTEKGQWYAVYKVLSDCHGYPVKMTEFCSIMADWGMGEVSPACSYDSMKRIPSSVTFPTLNVTLWPHYLSKADDKFRKQIKVAMKLQELLQD